MTETDLRARAAAIRWFHTMDLGHGVSTAGVVDTEYRLAMLDLPASLSGLTVLDIGAWDGFFSFECERRGAARVVAADWHSWHGPGWGTKQGFELAREALGSHVIDVDVDVLDLDPNRLGRFDLVLFLGVLYHLKDPMLGLEKVANLTKGKLILETVVDLVGLRRPAAAFYPGQELNNDPTNWWGPNPAAVTAMLRAVGFSDVRMVTTIPSPPYRAARALWHHLKGKNRWSQAFRLDRAVFHATKTTAR
jgi:tRNA (mo5U34)-methyltransferase